jgi:hypothetical protein
MRIIVVAMVISSMLLGFMQERAKSFEDTQGGLFSRFFVCFLFSHLDGFAETHFLAEKASSDIAAQRSAGAVETAIIVCYEVV